MLQLLEKQKDSSDTGTRTQVCRVRGGYDNHLHHIGARHFAVELSQN